MDLPESEISVDPVIVTAILDRILRHSTINIPGKSEGKGGREKATFFWVRCPLVFKHLRHLSTFWGEVHSFQTIR